MQSTDPEIALHLFEIQDNDTVVAGTAEEALEIWLKDTGYTRDDLEADDDVVQVPDDRIVKAWVDADGNIGEHSEGTLTALTAGEWARRFGTGLLFSREG